MDNITHTLTGWALGQAGLKTASRKGLAALILAANMPDIDVFFGGLPYEPLAMHRGFTHSLVAGLLLMPPLLTGLLLLLDRWQVRRATRFRSGLAMHPARLLGLAYLGALTHPLLDLLTTYSVQLLSPFNGRWWHADALFIVDVWLWSLLGLTIAWSRMREKQGRSWRRGPRLAIAAALIYIAVNILITQRAYVAARGWAALRPVDRMFASPPPVRFWERELVWSERACYRRAQFDPLVGLGAVGPCEAPGMDAPLVRAAIASEPKLQSFLRWSILPQADVQRQRCGATVTISDARYGDRRNSRLSREARLKLPC